MEEETVGRLRKQGKRTARLTRIIDIRASYYEAELLKELKIPKEAFVQDHTVPLFPQYLPKVHSPAPKPLSLASIPPKGYFKAYSTPQSHHLPKTERSANLRMQVLERRIRALDQQLAKLRPAHTRGSSLPL